MFVAHHSSPNEWFIPEKPHRTGGNVASLWIEKDTLYRISLTRHLVHLVYLVYLVCLVYLVLWLNETNQRNQINQIHETNQPNQIDQTNQVVGGSKGLQEMRI